MVVADFSAPVCTFTVTSAVVTSPDVELEVAWACEDRVSGIRLPMQLWIGTSAGANDVLHPVDVAHASGSMREAVTEPVPLLSGRQYFVTLEAVNGAALTTWTTAPPVRVDTSPPTVYGITVEDAAQGYLDSAVEVVVSWQALDRESGIAMVSVCIVRDGVHPVPLSCVTVPGHSVATTLPSLDSLLLPSAEVPLVVTVTVTATNGVAVNDTATSTPLQVVVLSPPFGPLTADDAGPEGGAHLCSRHVGGLHVSWTYPSAPGAAPLSSLSLSLWSHGVLVAGERKVALVGSATGLYVSNPAFVQGASLDVCLNATDVVGRTASRCTGTVSIDTTPPEISSVVVGTGAGSAHVPVWSTAAGPVTVHWVVASEDVPGCPLVSTSVDIVRVLDRGIVAPSGVLAAGNEWIVPNATRDSVLATSGTLQAVVTVTNAAGLSTSAASQAFSVDGNRPHCPPTGCRVSAELVLPFDLVPSSGTGAGAVPVPNCTLAVSLSKMVAGTALARATWTVRGTSTSTPAGFTLLAAGASVVQVHPGSHVTFDVPGLTLALKTSVVVEFVVQSLSGLTSDPLSSPPTKVTVDVGIPGSVVNGYTGPVPAGHVALQADGGYVTASWTAFVDAATSLPAANCLWGVRLSTAPANATTHVPCASGTASALMVPPLQPGLYVIDVVASTLDFPRHSFMGTSPVFTVLPPPVVALDSSSATFRPFVSSTSVCTAFVVSYHAPALGTTYVPLAGTLPLGDDVPVQGTTVSVVNLSPLGDPVGTPTAFVAANVSVCVTPLSAGSPFVSAHLGLRMCDALGRCASHAGAGLVTLDVVPPRVDQAVVVHTLPRAGATAIRATDPWTCTWHGVLDEGAGLDRFLACFTSTYRRAECDLGPPQSVPVISAWRLDWNWTASANASAVTAVSRAVASSRRVFCTIEAIDRAGNSATLYSTGVPVLMETDAALARPDTVSVSMAAGRVVPPHTTYRHTIGLAASWTMGPSASSTVASLWAQAHSVSASGVVVGNVTEVAGPLPASTRFHQWPTAQLLGLSFVAVSLYAVDVAGVQGLPLLSSPVQVEAEAFVGTSPDLLAWDVTLVSGSAPLGVACGEARGFADPLSTVSVRVANGSTGEALLPDIPCGHQASVSTTSTTAWVGGEVATVSYVEHSTSGLSVVNRTAGLAIGVDAYPCPHLGATLSSPYFPMHDPTGDPRVVARFHLPSAGFVPLTSAVLRVGTSPGAADLYSLPATDPYAEATTTQTISMSLFSPGVSRRPCFPVYACLRVSAFGALAPECDVCTASPAWVDLDPPLVPSSSVHVFPGQ